MASSSGISRFADLVSVDEFPEGHGNENNRKKTKENIALLKDFLTLKNESRTQKKFCHTNSIHSVHAFTNEKSTKIITSVHCVVWLPAVKGIWQNYGYIIIKDAEFEENVNGLKVKDLKKNWRSAKSTSDVIFPGCCIFTEQRPIQHFNQSAARCITGKKMKQNLLQSGTKDCEY